MFYKQDNYNKELVYILKFHLVSTRLSAKHQTEFSGKIHLVLVIFYPTLLLPETGPKNTFHFSKLVLVEKNSQDLKPDLHQTKY